MIAVFFSFQAKNSQEGLLLEDIHAYMKKRAAIEKTYGESLLKLTNQFQGHKIIPIPDLGQRPIQPVGEDDNVQQQQQQPAENVSSSDFVDFVYNSYIADYFSNISYISFNHGLTQVTLF